MNCSRTLSATVLGLLLCAVSLHAGIVETVRERYGSATAITTDIDLTILWKVREKQESRSGTMQLAKGDKFRVELGPTVWVCNGQTVWQYSSASNQVVVKRLLDFDLSSQPSQMLQTFVHDYDYRVLEETDKQAVLFWEADSSHASSFYRTVTAFYDKRKNVISSFVLIDRHGNESTYRFSKTILGASIPRETFEFAIPKGAHVLDERE
jgi:outer membrane lipoprotein-sorting protein